MRTLLIFLFGCSVALTSAAQGFYNNGAVVSISSQTLVVIPDSLVNKGTLINNGDINIAGAWLNTGTYTAGQGMINFDGDQPQTINHNDQTVEKLSISGGGEKRFQANITVLSELNLESGVLTSQNGARLIMDKDVVLTGGSNSSHVKGPVERKGSGDWLFPIGNGTIYLPVVISGVKDIASSGIMSLHELSNGETLTGAEDLEHISTKRYWNLAFVGSSLKDSKITLPLADEGDLGNNNSLIVVAGATTNVGPYSSIGQSGITGSSTAGVVTSEGSPSFIFFTVAALSDDHTIEVYNAVSAGDDGKNDFMMIKNIQFYPQNRVLIHNRWGDRVFETTSYDNAQNSFKGMSANGTKLPSGTYFYSISLGDGTSAKTGYLIVR